MSLEPTGESSLSSARVARGRGLCTFWLGDRHFGLDVALVGEVVTVDTIARVPQSQESLRGLFNLRGTPVALLDLGPVLGIEDIAPPHAGGAVTALVVQSEGMLVGFVIDRMEAVVPDGRGTFTQPGTDDHVAVRGFLELPGASRVVTVLETTVLLERLEAMRFVKAEE